MKNKAILRRLEALEKREVARVQTLKLTCDIFGNGKVDETIVYTRYADGSYRETGRYRPDEKDGRDGSYLPDEEDGRDGSYLPDQEDGS
jgi:hypothetical protein